METESHILPIRAHIVLSLAWTSILLLNLIFLQSASVGFVFSLLYVMSAAVALRRRLFPNQGSFVGILLGGFGVLALFVVLSVPVYWLLGWHAWGVIAIMYLMPLIIALFPARPRTMCPDDSSITLAMSTSARTMHGFFIFVLQVALLAILFRSQITHSVISPWEALPSYFMPLFVITTLFLATYYLRRDASCGLFLAGLHAVIMCGVAWIVFPLGYGFDPFIHRAAVMHIFEHGVIDPKTPYYIGQYTILSGIGHIITPTAMAFFDRLLVPLLAPIMIVISMAVAMRRAGATRFVPLLSLTVFIIPFSTFIATTPQALANLFFAVLVILSITLIKHEGVSMIYVWLLALASAAVHPLAGVPALVFAFIVTVAAVRGRRITRAVVICLTFAASSFILPFLLLWHMHGRGVFSKLFDHLGKPMFAWATNFIRPLDPTLDILYAYRSLLLWLIVLVFGYGLWLIVRAKEMRTVAVIYLGMASMLLTNASLMAGGMTLPLVIDYEQQNYSLRVMEMFVLVLFPLIVTGAYYYFDRVNRAEWMVRFVAIMVFVVALSGGMYFSYPQNNPVERSRGYTVSQVDFDTVDAIKKHAGGVSYAVLANQAVSAAAIQSLGFSNYYATSDGEQFLYPIPTGGRLYGFYLEMIYGDPGQRVAHQAMEYMDVDRVYLVVSPYWWDADAISAQAIKQSQDSFQLNWTNRVFVYLR